MDSITTLRTRRRLALAGVAALALMTACKPDVRARHTPLNPTAGQTVTFDVTAYDPQGVAEIKIWVNGAAVKTCTSTTTCSFTGGPYPGNDQGYVTYSARAKDTQGNQRTIGSYHFAIGRPWNDQAWIPVRLTDRAPSDAIDVCFAGDFDYDAEVEDLQTDINTKIFDRYFQNNPIQGHRDKYNFYYTTLPVDAANCGQGVTMLNALAGTFCDAFAVLHVANFRDCTVGLRFSAEGGETKAFIHESGHALYGLADEYEGDTSYSYSGPFHNIWPDVTASAPGEQWCQADVSSYGGDASKCQEFCDNSNLCGFGWWRYGTATTVMTNGIFTDPWGLPALKRLEHVHGQY